MLGRVTTADDRAEDASAGRRLVVASVVAVAFVLAFWGAARSCNWFLDEPFLMLPIDAANGAESSRTLTHVEGLLQGVAGVTLVPAVAIIAWSLRKRRSPLDAAEEFLRGDPRVVPVLMAAIAVAGSAFVGYALIRHVELLDDERSYMFQAELFAHGKISEPALPSALRNQMILVTPVHASKYPPGNALLLAIGVLLHVPYLVHPLLAGALVLTVHALTRDLWGERSAHLAAGLVAVSPFTWAIHGTVLSFGPTACGFALALAGIVRHRRTGSAVSAIVAGLGGAFLLVCRPLDGLSLGVPALVWGLVRSPARARYALFAGLGYAALAWMIPVHNRLVGGSITTFPWSLDYESIMRIGFTQSYRGPYVHSPLGAMAIEATMLQRIDAWFIGVPGALLVIVLGALRRDPKGGGTLFRILLATYWGIWLLVPGAGTWDVGPTYCFVLVPMLAPLFVRGVAVLAEQAAKLTTEGRALVHWAVVAAVGVALVATTPIRFTRLTVLADAISAPWDAVAASDIGEAVVVVPTVGQRGAAGWGYGYPYEIATGASTEAHLFLPLNRREYDAARPTLPAVPTYALELDLARSAQLRHRQYRIVPFDPEVRWPTKTTDATRGTPPGP